MTCDPEAAGDDPFPSPHVTFGGSSPGLPVKATKLAAEALKEERGRDLQPSSLPQVRQKSPPPLAAQSLPKPPMQPPPASRVPVLEDLPRGAVGGKATPSSTKSWTPQGVKDTSASPSPDRLTPGGTPVQLLSGTPVGTPAGATVVRKESRISRSRSRSPRPTSAFRQVRTAQTEDGRRSPKRCPSPPRLATSRDLVSACSDEIATAEYALAIVGAQHTTPPAPPLGPEGERFHDKAVQVHIRQLDRRLIACSILAGVLAVALVAVVLFALLAK